MSSSKAPGKFGLNIRKSGKLGKGKVALVTPKAFATSEQAEEEEERAPDGSLLNAKRAPLPPPSSLFLDPPVRSVAPGREEEGEEKEKGTTTEEDAMYDYDRVYDQMKAAKVQYGLQKRQGPTGEDRKARYMEDIMVAAERRKVDHARAEERMIQREREAEGDEFKDKESFVTESFARHQEELRAAEAAEEAREARDGKGKVAGFYRTFLGDQADERSAIISATLNATSQGPPMTSRVKEDEKRKDAPRHEGVMRNDADEVVDKRELLSAGLNISRGTGTGGRGAHLQDKEALRKGYTRAGPKDAAAGSRKEGARERESAMLERQLLARTEGKRKEEEREREELAAKVARKTDDAGVQSARERYLARKSAAGGRRGLEESSDEET